MDREAWNERYRAGELVWGAEPNRFVAEARQALDFSTRKAILSGVLGWIAMALLALPLVQPFT